MVWEIILGVILAIGILTTIREIWRRKGNRKKTASTREGSRDGNTL